MGHYLFLEDGRRVDVEGGRVTLFPDDGFRFRDAIHIGDIERTVGGWTVKRNGRDLGAAPSRRAAVAQLMDDAAEDIAAREQDRREELATHAEAGELVRRFLPDYGGDAVLPPALMFAPEELMELLWAVDEHGLEDEAPQDEPDPHQAPESEPDRSSEPRAPSFEEFAAALRELIGIDLERDPVELAQMAALGITAVAWRNTHLESLHAGSHPSGGFPDLDMMRYNIATSRAVAEHVTPTGVDWGALHGLLTDAERPLPGGITVRDLAGGELTELLTDSASLLWGLQRIDMDDGTLLLYGHLAMQASLYCRDWFGTPWWPDAVDAFLELLADPSSSVWEDDERSRPEPAAVADRERLRATLLERPDALDDESLRWCRRHGLGYLATRRGFVRWRRRRDPDWEDPSPWLSEAA